MTRPGGTHGPADGTTPSPPDRLHRQTSRLLSQLTTRSDRLINEGLAEADARKWHYAVLASLQEHGAASQAELSRRSGIHRSDMVGVLNELTERQFVERTPDSADQRRNVVTITESGSRNLVRLDAILDELNDALLAPLRPLERERFADFLSRLLRHHAHTPQGHGLGRGKVGN